MPDSNSAPELDSAFDSARQIPRNLEKSCETETETETETESSETEFGEGFNEILRRIFDILPDSQFDIDNDGQIIIYTGLRNSKDGTINPINSSGFF